MDRNSHTISSMQDIYFIQDGARKNYCVEITSDQLSDLPRKPLELRILDENDRKIGIARLKLSSGVTVVNGRCYEMEFSLTGKDVKLLRERNYVDVDIPLGTLWVDIINSAA